MPNISRIFFQTALEVKELQDGRLVGNELECAMVRRMGGLEQSEAQIYPKFIQKESLTRNLPLFGWCNAAVSFFFFSFFRSDDMQILRELHFDHVSMTSGVVIRSL